MVMSISLSGPKSVVRTPARVPRVPLGPQLGSRGHYFGHCCHQRVIQLRPLNSATLFQVTFIPLTSILGKGNQSCWPSNLCCSAAAYMALSIFTQYAFKGHRCDRSWIQRHLRNWGAFPKKICKIQPKSLLPASFPGKKVRWVGPGKRSSEGGKWRLVKRA